MMVETCISLAETDPLGTIQLPPQNIEKHGEGRNLQTGATRWTAVQINLLLVTLLSTHILCGCGAVMSIAYVRQTLSVHIGPHPSEPQTLARDPHKFRSQRLEP